MKSLDESQQNHQESEQHHMNHSLGCHLDSYIHLSEFHPHQQRACLQNRDLSCIRSSLHHQQTKQMASCLPEDKSADAS